MQLSFIKYNGGKFQRLGLLKILLALLNPQKRSTSADAINRKLSDLFIEIQHPIKSNNKTKPVNRYLAGKLIIAADSPSYILRITDKYIHEILRWGMICGFVGSGNQISERGLILRNLMGEEAVSSIIDKSYHINPFRLTKEEKLYFLYRLLEIDSSTYFLIKRLADHEVGDPIDGVSADHIACHSFYDLYQIMNESRSISKDIIVRQLLRDLIGKMVSELGLESDIPLRYKVQTPMRPLRTTKLKDPYRALTRKKTNTSDDEAITRFEYLTDLGMLQKKTGGHDCDNEEDVLYSWKYRVTPVLKKFASKMPDEYIKDFCYIKFAEAATSFIDKECETLTMDNDAIELASRAYEAYQLIKKPFGHTSVESIAIITMIKAVCEFKILEVNAIHKFFLHIKTKGLFQNDVFFASGNDLEKMFISLKPNFRNEVTRYYEG